MVSSTSLITALCALMVAIPSTALLTWSVAYDYGYDDGHADATTRTFRCDDQTIEIRNWKGEFPQMTCKEWVALPNN